MPAVATASTSNITTETTGKYLLSRTIACGLHSSRENSAFHLSISLALRTTTHAHLRGRGLLTTYRKTSFAPIKRRKIFHGAYDPELLAKS